MMADMGMDANVWLTLSVNDDELKVVQPILALLGVLDVIHL